jgi:hypothetical protein
LEVSQRDLGFSAHRMRRGANRASPAASPSHHVNQIEGASIHGAKPPRTRELTPTVAATVVLTSPVRTKNLITSWPRSKARRPEAKRVTR